MLSVKVVVVVVVAILWAHSCIAVDHKTNYTVSKEELYYCDDGAEER